MFKTLSHSLSHMQIYLLTVHSCAYRVSNTHQKVSVTLVSQLCTPLCTLIRSKQQQLPCLWCEKVKSTNLLLVLSFPVFGTLQAKQQTLLYTVYALSILTVSLNKLPCSKSTHLQIHATTHTLTHLRKSPHFH